MLLSGFKKTSVFALVALAVAAMATDARAMLVTYETTGAFDGSPAYPGLATTSTTINGITIAFTGITSNTVNTNTTGGFGSFVTSGNVANLASIAGHFFTLFITQTAPPGLNHGSYVGTLVGQIKVQQSQAYVEFSPTSQSITTASGVTSSYKVLNADEVNGQGVPKEGSVSLNAPAAGGGDGAASTINGFISTSVPEPATIASAVAGLILLAGVARFRRRAA